jgi:hypothetical protein
MPTPPPFPLSAHTTKPIVFKTTSVVVPSPFHPFPSQPRLCQWSRAPPSWAKLLVALPSTGAPSAVRIWPVLPLFPLSSVRHPPSLSSPDPRPSLTFLSSSDLQGASPTAGDHRRPSLSSKHPRPEAPPLPRRRQPSPVGFLRPRDVRHTPRVTPQL